MSSKAKTALYIAQAELDEEWSKLYDTNVGMNDAIMQFFISVDAEKNYKQDYLEAIKRINDKYNQTLTRATFDSVLNNVFQGQSIQSWRPDWETTTWELLYPKEMKAAREKEQKREAREAQREANEAKKDIIKKRPESPPLTIGGDVNIELSYCDV